MSFNQVDDEPDQLRITTQANNHSPEFSQPTDENQTEEKKNPSFLNKT